MAGLPSGSATGRRDFCWSTSRPTGVSLDRDRLLLKLETDVTEAIDACDHGSAWFARSLCRLRHGGPWGSGRNMRDDKPIRVIGVIIISSHLNCKFISLSCKCWRNFHSAPDLFQWNWSGEVFYPSLPVCICAGGSQRKDIGIPWNYALGKGFLQGSTY